MHSIVPYVSWYLLYLLSCLILFSVVFLSSARLQLTEKEDFSKTRAVSSETWNLTILEFESLQTIAIYVIVHQNIDFGNAEFKFVSHDSSSSSKKVTPQLLILIVAEDLKQNVNVFFWFMNNNVVFLNFYFLSSY